MSATHVQTYRFSVRSADEDLRGGASSETHVYRVRFSDGSAYAYQAINAPGIPEKSSRLGESNLYVARRSAKQLPDDLRVFEVEVVFTTLQAAESQPMPAGTGDHDKWNVRISGSGVAREESIQLDRHGNVLVNTLGEPFDPEPTLKIYDEQITVAYFVRIPEWEVLKRCRGKANSEQITLAINGAERVFDPYTLLLENYVWDAEIDSDGNAVISVQLVLVERVLTWTERRANKSFNILVDGQLQNLLSFNPVTGETEQRVIPAYINEAGTTEITSGPAYLNELEIVDMTSFVDLLSGI